MIQTYTDMNRQSIWTLKDTEVHTEMDDNLQMDPTNVETHSGPGHLHKHLENRILLYTHWHTPTDTHAYTGLHSKVTDTGAHTGTQTHESMNTDVCVHMHVRTRTHTHTHAYPQKHPLIKKQGHTQDQSPKQTQTIIWYRPTTHSYPHPRGHRQTKTLTNIQTLTVSTEKVETSYRLLNTFGTWPSSPWWCGSTFIACLQTNQGDTHMNTDTDSHK
jgi:hypothetical protein